MLKYSFKINDKEQEILNKWHNKHKKTCPYFKALKIKTLTRAQEESRQQFTFILDGIGMVIVYKCYCGETHNITDYDSW